MMIGDLKWRAFLSFVCSVLVLDAAVASTPAGKIAYVRQSGPKFLSYQELVTVSDHDETPPALNSKLTVLMTTPFVKVQPAGTTNKKQKHQQYDLSFASISGKEYTCRTAQQTSVKATDLVVGSSVTYEVNGDKGKVKTVAGKQVSCIVVRVAIAPADPK